MRNLAGDDTVLVMVQVVDQAPASLQYNQSAFILLLNSTTEIPAPRYTGGQVTLFSTSSRLPSNLVLDPRTGKIGGVCVEEILLYPINITAQNSGGSSSTTFAISCVYSVPKPVFNAVLPRLQVNQYAQINLADWFECMGCNLARYSINPESVFSLQNIGLVFDANTATISGILRFPTANLTVLASTSNSGGAVSVTKVLKVLVESPSLLSLVNKVPLYVDRRIDPPIECLQGGGPIDRYELAPIALPPGVVFSAFSGRISGGKCVRLR
jgi:hypothetical protein